MCLGTYDQDKLIFKDDPGFEEGEDEGNIVDLDDDFLGDDLGGSEGEAMDLNDYPYGNNLRLTQRNVDELSYVFYLNKNNQICCWERRV